MTDALFAVIETWIQTVLGSITVIRGRQLQADVPRPEMPYAMVWIATDLAVSIPFVRTTDVASSDMVEQKHELPRRGTLRVDIYGEDSVAQAETLQVSPGMPDVAVALRAANVALRPVGEVLDATLLRDTGYEPSAAVEFYLHRVQEETVTVYPIETAVVPLTLEG